MTAPRSAPAPRGTLGGGARKYLEVARTAFSSRLAYLGGSLSRPLFFAMILFVFVQLWQKVFTPDRPVVAGFTMVDTLWYLMLTEAILLSAPRLDGRVDEEVKSGGLAIVLGRPCHYLLYHLAFCLGEAVPLLAMSLVAGAVVVSLLIGPPPIVWSSLPIVASSVGLAFVLHFYISMCVALLAFWVEDATPFFWIYSKMLFILGGLMIPLDFFPAWLQTLAGALPFRHILCGPARLTVRYSAGDALALVGWQCGWIALIGLAAHG
ncbi:MAG: ABC-2 family transporter protein, partial [Candidatus Riflebacteria bacterium]|nr:ABC-2 family transporter protein [Candidatus Riflebacteria bacterium]